MNTFLLRIHRDILPNLPSAIKQSSARCNIKTSINFGHSRVMTEASAFSQQRIILSIEFILQRARVATAKATKGIERK